MTDPFRSTSSDDPSTPGASSAADTQYDGASATAGSSDDLAGVQRELADARDRHLRLAAEYDNFRRRAAKERQEAGWRAQGDLVRGLLDAIDDITRFAHVDPATVDAKTVVDGVAMVEKKLMKSLAAQGFEIIDPVGHAFDPTKHEAVSTAPATSAGEDGDVAVVFQVGYLINGVVLRPARVVVKQWSGGSAQGRSDAPLVS